MAINENVIPPTINHKTVDPEIDKKLNLTLNKAQEKVIYAMSNTFGLGGTMHKVLFKNTHHRNL